MYWRYELDTRMQLSLFITKMLDYSSKAMGSAASADRLMTPTALHPI